MNELEKLWNRWWFELKVPASKLNLLRVLFFSILALDLFLQLEHAPRYGAGDFNVSHVPWLDSVLGTPSRLAIVVSYLVQSYLAARVVFGVEIRRSVRLLAVLYGLTYLVSQLDAYQHHYLICLLLVVASFIPWDQARDQAEGDRDPHVATWALRLFTVQLALLYFWAAVAKMDPAWLDGSTLERQMTVEWVRGAIEGTVGYGGMAWMIMLLELGLGVAICFRKVWPLVWLGGVGLHVSVELAGFKIGLFSYFMLGLYVVFLPDRWITTAARAVARPTLARLPRPRNAGFLPRPVAAAVAGLTAVALVALLPFEGSGTSAALIAVLGVAAVALDRSPAWRVMLGHTAACAVLLVLHVGTDQALNYYKFLGGTARRLGDDDTMKMAYRRLTEVAPSYGPAYYHLGNLARRKGELDDAQALFREAQLRQPRDPRPFVGSAQIFLDRGDVASARDILEVCMREVPDPSRCRDAMTRVPEGP